jgi:hypothetical protein
MDECFPKLEDFLIPFSELALESINILEQPSSDSSSPKNSRPTEARRKN